MFGHRQRQHEGVGVHATVVENQSSPQGDRQHEQIDGEQIERKQPDRLADVCFVDVFHHQHLELPGQEQKRHHR